MGELTTAVALAALTPVGAPAQEKHVEHEDCSDFTRLPVPRYKIARKYHTPIGSMLVMHMSLQPRDITRDNLLALACSIGAKYSGEQNLIIYIFDNTRAAKKYYFLGEDNTRETERSHRAEYSFLRDQNYHALKWCPDPDRCYDKNQWVTIDLGKSPAPPKR